MASYHDAYLFRPEPFMQGLLPYLEALQQGDSAYAALRTAAIGLFDRSPQVRYLASTYGDWDRNRLLAGAPVERPHGFHHVAFWFVILLYGSLMLRPQALGLGGKWEVLASGLQQMGWDPQQTTRLVRGRSFADLAQSLPGQTRLGYWHHFYPYTKNGYAGWLAASDVQLLHRSLAALAPRVRALSLDPTHPHDDFQRSYRAATEMTAAAQDAQTGLCLIMTG